jgi:hypothetical protein
MTGRGAAKCDARPRYLGWPVAVLCLCTGGEKTRVPQVLKLTCAPEVWLRLRREDWGGFLLAFTEWVARALHRFLRVWLDGSVPSCDESSVEVSATGIDWSTSGGSAWAVRSCGGAADHALRDPTTSA